MKRETLINLASLVNSHAKPFVVIDRNYHILAVNKAYEQRYGISNEESIGRMCYQVSHGKNRPCSIEGEDCPHEHVFNNGKSKACVHIHCDANHRMHQVRVSAYPLQGAGNELLLGESIEDISTINPHVSGTERMVGESVEFLACVHQLNDAANSDAPVLLQGETGTGKGLAAEYIHQHSARSKQPFQIIDSTVFADNLFESEMFGHANGAYTGSVGDTQGLFELADGGTVFLDEVGELPASQQAKLLRVLESGEYRRVGGKRTRKTDVRIICATNRHLWESVIAGAFREDLYYRIACLNIRLPSLYERLDDVPVLAQSLIEGINQSMSYNCYLTPDVFARLKTYRYPGNIRELRNILFIAATRSQNGRIDAALITKVFDNLPHCVDLHDIKNRIMDDAVLADSSEPNEQRVTLKDLEIQHISELLKKYQGNRKKAAAALGISERTIYRKLKRLGVS